MSEKMCTKCEIVKPLEDFRWRNKEKGTKQVWCKGCFTTHERETWKSSPERRDSNKARNKDRVKRNRQFVWDYLKEHPCSCGEANPILLEFDHRDPSTKSCNVSEFSRSSNSLVRITEEIEKCDVLCVRCHRLRTAEQFGWHAGIVK